MPKDDATWLNICYVIVFFLAFYLGWKAINTVGIQMGWAERYDEWFPAVHNIVAIVIGVVTFVVMRSDKAKHEYYLNTIAELRKVTWPSMEDTKKMTLIVVVVVGIFGAILAVFDLFWAKALNLLLT